MARGIIIIVFFIIMAALMMTRKLPVFLALIALAVGIPLIAGLPLMGTDADGNDIGIITTCIGNGSMMMSSAMGAIIFGAWFGRMVTSTGVSRKLVKVAAELGGDRPLVVALAILAVLSVLWTSVTGLGATIMLGTIAIPIMISVGIPALVAGCIYMMGMAIGFNFNMTQWSSFMNIFQLELSDIKSFTSMLFVITAVVAIAFVFIEFKRAGVKYSFAAPAKDTDLEENEDELVKGWRGVVCCFAPIVTLISVIFLNVGIVPSFIIGILWLVIFGSQGGYTRTVNRVVKCAYDCLVDCAPAIILLTSVGMLYTAVTKPQVASVLQPMLASVIPTSKFGYILFFVILTPLVLYRGPFNLFGLGSGIAAVVSTGGILSPLATMGAFIAMERMQCIGCPTNTQNVWVASYLEMDVNNMTRKMMPYLWIMSAAGVVISAFRYL